MTSFIILLSNAIAVAVGLDCVICNNTNGWSFLQISSSSTIEDVVETIENNTEGILCYNTIIDSTLLSIIVSTKYVCATSACSL